VLSEAIVIVEPEDQTPDALPSRLGAVVSANSCSEREPEGIAVEEENCGDQRYMLCPAGKVKDPAD
jgi:hypothetical protein